MNSKEYQLLAIAQIRKPVLKGQDLSNRDDRTLIYGYNVARQTFHVYLRAGVIHRVTYRDGKLLEHKTEAEITYDHFYAPEKRAYPERCDFEFCLALTLRGVEIPFTTFDAQGGNLEGQYFGLTLENLTPAEQVLEA